jgi:hypothetical protein
VRIVIVRLIPGPLTRNETHPERRTTSVEGKSRHLAPRETTIVRYVRLTFMLASKSAKRAPVSTVTSTDFRYIGDAIQRIFVACQPLDGVGPNGTAPCLNGNDTAHTGAIPVADPVPYGENELAGCDGLARHALTMSAERNGSTLDLRSSVLPRSGPRSEPDSVLAEPDSRVSSLLPELGNS